MKTLYFFTNRYPYGGESFVGNELDALSAHFDKIKLYTSANSGAHKDPMAANIELVQIKEPSVNKLKLIVSNIGLIFTVFRLELKNKDKQGLMKGLRYNLSVLLSALQRAEGIYETFKTDSTDKSYVSFWMDKWALCLAILKYKKRIPEFYFRVHQFDLYIDENPEAYIPFRFFNIKMAAAVLPDSTRGVNFLKKFNFYPEKIKIGHLGVPDRGMNPFDSSETVIVSCSSLIKRKRVGNIVESLKLVKSKVRWIHFGASGETPLVFEELKQKCQHLPSNIEVILKGDVSYEELLSFYKQNPVSLFITLTRAEGLPVSVIEAISFGIPVIATDVMGIKDIVNNGTGFRLEPDAGSEEIAGIIDDFNKSEKNSVDFRHGVKQYWLENFHSDKNYTHFLNSLLIINHLQQLAAFNNTYYA